jgi:hypothetical protein
MIHLISVEGINAKHFYLEQQCIPDFKSLVRTVTSGRVMIVSTKFRSDLFYNAEKPENDSILKMWALYAKTDLCDIDREEIVTSIGADESLSQYFQSINQLSTNWHKYLLYTKTFRRTFHNDQQNPVARIVVGCDQHLVEHPSTKRAALVDISERIGSELTKDTFSLAMRIINNENSSN